MLTTQNVSHTSYSSPLTERYASKEMERIFSPHFKYSTWRKLWVSLARAQQELGLSISDAQIGEMEENIDDIDFDRVEEWERELHHDVMAHIKTFGEQCPAAEPIIHLGATSCYVTDNTDTIQIQEALAILLPKLHRAVATFASLAEKYKSTPCLGYTHFQPAQPTTVGKRICLWLQDFVLDAHQLSHAKKSLRFLGAKGATGGQGSFYSLFNNSYEKVEELDRRVAETMGFSSLFTITGQTYTRKQDVQILHALASFASSIHKFGTDLRLLAHMGEIEEGFGKNQVGSSAMPYKRNPILSERMCSLARFLLSLSENGVYTHATQWLERSLDDSANRRLCLPEAFLTADALVECLNKVVTNIQVNEEVISRRLREELPFIASENILMLAVQKGGNRQELHEKIRQHSCQANDKLKKEGGPNDLLDRLKNDPSFNLTQADLEQILHPRSFLGLAPRQVDRFLEEEVLPTIPSL